MDKTINLLEHQIHQLATRPEVEGRRLARLYLAAFEQLEKLDDLVGPGPAPGAEQYIQAQQVFARVLLARIFIEVYRGDWQQFLEPLVGTVYPSDTLDRLDRAIDHYRQAEAAQSQKYQREDEDDNDDQDWLRSFHMLGDGG